MLTAWTPQPLSPLFSPSCAAFLRVASPATAKSPLAPVSKGAPAWSVACLATHRTMHRCLGSACSRPMVASPFRLAAMPSRNRFNACARKAFELLRTVASTLADTDGPANRRWMRCCGAERNGTLLSARLVVWTGQKINAAICLRVRLTRSASSISAKAAISDLRPRSSPNVRSARMIARKLSIADA